MLTLHNGDWREYIQRNGANFDAVITDPPYGTGEHMRQDGEIMKTRQDWDVWNFEWFEHVKHLRGAFFIPPALVLSQKWEGFRLMSWNSPCPMKWKNVAPRYGIQPILGFGKFPDKASLDWYKVRSMQTTDHPHQKPLEVMRWLIETVSEVGDTIFDPFMGSGSTGVAAIQTGRHFVGCEISAEYFSIAEKRIKSAVFQPSFLTPSNNRLHLTGGESPANLSLFPAEVIPPAKLPAKSPRR